MGNDLTTFRPHVVDCGTSISPRSRAETQAFVDRPRRFAAALPLAMLLAATTIALGCSYDTATRSYVATGRVTDPSGDTFGTGTTRWDLTAMTITRNTAGIAVALDFTHDVISPMSRDTSAVLGVVDLDVDQDASTGVISAVDHFRPGDGSTGIRADYQLLLTGYAPDSSVAVIDSLGQPTGRVKPVFSANRITIQIPFALIGDDDGLLDASAIVATRGHKSDIIPENGHLTVGYTPSVGRLDH